MWQDERHGKQLKDNAWEVKNRKCKECFSFERNEQNRIYIYIYIYRERERGRIGERDIERRYGRTD